MQIEHITLGGNSTLRDSDIILPETIEILKPFQIKDGVKAIKFPHTEIIVKVSTTTEGALFDMTKDGRIGVSNVCCFNDKYSQMMFNMVKTLHEITKFGDQRLPVLHNWIYSVPIDPTALTAEEIQICGEVELYIYYSLYLART